MLLQIIVFVGLSFVTCSAELNLESEINKKAVMFKGKVFAWACEYVSEDEETTLQVTGSFVGVQSLDRGFELPDPAGRKILVWGYDKQPLKKDSNGNIIVWKCIQLSKKTKDGDIVMVAPDQDAYLNALVKKIAAAGEWIGDQVKTGVKVAGQWIGDQVKTGVKVTADGIVYVGDKIYDGLKTTATGVVKVSEKVFEGLKDTATGVAKVSEKVFEGLKDTANDVGNAIKSGFNKFVSFFGRK